MMASSSFRAAVLFAAGLLLTAPANATDEAQPWGNFAALVAEAEQNPPPPSDLPADLADTATAWRLVGDRLDLRLADGRIARATAQIIGYWLVDEQEFAWAWNGADDDNPALDAVKAVRTSGKEWGMAELSGQVVPSTRQEAQALFLVSLYLAGGLSPFHALRADGNRALIGVGGFTLSEAAE